MAGQLKTLQSAGSPGLLVSGCSGPRRPQVGLSGCSGSVLGVSGCAAGSLDFVYESTCITGFIGAPYKNILAPENGSLHCPALRGRRPLSPGNHW